MALRLRPLDLGSITAPHSLWESGADDDPFLIPVTGWLIEHPKGTVLFDCGMHTDMTSATPKLESYSVFLDVGADGDAMVAAQLCSLDVDPADVDALIASHLHWDHVGGLAQLPNADLIVQRAVWETATDPDVAAVSPYDLDEYQTGHRVVLVDGEHDVFGDGSITCIPTPGHTAGHQSLLVDGDAGRLLLTGDCCYFERTVDGGALPPFGHDLERQVESVRAIRVLRDAGATVIPAHDPDFWSRRPVSIG